MTGIHYLTDGNGKPVAVQIDLRKHASLWEDFQDMLVANSRKDEPSTPLEEVRAHLIRRGKLR
jgi:hypothetical protein